MKINTKTILTILIIVVVALGAFLLWKKLKKDNTVNDKAEFSDNGPEAGTFEYIMANVPFTNSEVRYINKVRNAINASTTRTESVRAKASKKGNTFDEQVVLDAIWLLYHPEGSWIAGPDGKTDYGWRLQQKVLNLK